MNELSEQNPYEPSLSQDSDLGPNANIRGLLVRSLALIAIWCLGVGLQNFAATFFVGISLKSACLVALCFLTVCTKLKESVAALALAAVLSLELPHGFLRLYLLFIANCFLMGLLLRGISSWYDRSFRNWGEKSQGGE